MNETLDMTITISAVATPSLYRTLTGIPNPRQRAAFLKRIADDYLRGESSDSRNGQKPVLEHAANLPADANASGQGAALALEQAQNTTATSSVKALSINSDDDHYDFLESNLSVYE